MKFYELKDGRLNLTRCECFAEATAEELRVLLALIEGDFNFSSETELARVAKTSKSRVISALALFESEGVIAPYNGGNINYEFGDDGAEREAREVAKSIRDESLATVITECSEILNKATLSSTDVKQLVELYVDEGLSEEYIITLTAYLASASRNRSSVRSVCSKAKELKKKGIDNSEALNAYIKERQHDNPLYYSFKSFFKVWLRPLSEKEKEYALKWYGEFAYSDEIISKAYDASIQASKGDGYSLPYIDAVLTKWHEAGCKTVADCVAQSEITRAKLSAQSESAAKSGIRKSREAKTAAVPKYSNFNIEEVFAAALERSYGEDDD